MATTDVKRLLDLAVEKIGIREIAIRHPARYLSESIQHMSFEFKELPRVERDGPDPWCGGSSEDAGKDRSMKNEAKMKEYYQQPGESEIEWLVYPIQQRWVARVVE